MPTRRRLGEIQRAVFQVLLDHPDGRPGREVLDEVERRLPPTESENTVYASTGERKYPKTIRFATITAVKAGWLIKESGQWRLTPQGRDAYERFADPVAFEHAAIAGYRRWKETHGAGTTGYTAEEAADDAEAARLEADSTPRLRCWLVRGANVGGLNVLPRWFAEGFCSIRYAEVPPLARGTSRAEITRLVREALPDSGAPGLHAGVLHRFHNEMDVGDLVVTVDGRRVYVGRVASDPYTADDEDTARRRRVEWVNIDTPAARSQLSEEAADGLRGQLTVSDLSRYATEFARVAGLDDEEDDTAFIVEAVTEVFLPMPTQELGDELLLPREWLADLVDLLNDKRQIVLYGPPGTGKTYLAQQLCKALAAGAGGDYTIVQFHPSYAYEDFFEGFRPRVTTDGGGVGFELVKGPLRRLAEQAAQDPAHPYVLIIDEINRANVAKVFGELYFLLEYRGHSIQLQYSPDEPFTLPGNLFLIGTMNTADRSIALVDAAMRRRFYFQGLFPAEPPIRDVLRRWLASRGLPSEPADLLDMLNERIGDRDFAIGPSYLMSPRVADEVGLARIWRAAILPLLEEHYFGEGRSVQEEFGLAALRASRRADEPAAPSGEAVPPE